MMSSTIIGNSVLGCPVSAGVGWVSTGGGGIASSGSVTVINSTISGNTVAGRRGSRDWWRRRLLWICDGN